MEEIDNEYMDVYIEGNAVMHGWINGKVLEWMDACIDGLMTIR